MTSYHQNSKTSEDTINEDDLEKLEDDLLRKKKVRLRSKFSEKRWIP